jgi:membrane-associated protease RseP (regulator of RpoE activity)
VALSLCLGAAGCAAPRPTPPPRPYAAWERELGLAGSTLRTPEDVSRLLGTPPSRCDDVEPEPVIGIEVQNGLPVVARVLPAGAAARAGVAEGDRILAVNGRRTESGSDVVAALRAAAKWDAPLTVTTKTGEHVLTAPRPTRAQQCSWEIAEAPQREGARGAVFQATCRAYDGVLVGCESGLRE